MTKLYFVYDKVADSTRFFFTAESDGLACRRALMSLEVPLRDCELYCCAEVDSKNWKPYSEFRYVDWSMYRFPETVAEAYAPLKLTPDELNEVITSKEAKDA